MTDGYVLGRTSGETERLQLQASIYADASAYLFARAGIGAGMRVLDVGCGAGDVSMLLARLVGPTGAVIGVDVNPAILELARVRAAEAGLDNVTFVENDLSDLRLAEPVDALVGRLILLHLPEPAAIVRALSRSVRSGGIVSSQEFNVSSAHATPPTPLITRTAAMIVDEMRGAGVDPDFGLRVGSVLREAGLRVDGAATIAQAGSAESVMSEYVGISARSLLPAITALGLATEAERDLDTLSERLAVELRDAEALFQVPEVTGAWARVSQLR